MYCSDADKDDCTNHNSRTRTGLPFVKLYGLEDLLMKYNVDLVFWAHEHDFERFWPIYDFNIMNGSLAEPYTNPKVIASQQPAVPLFCFLTKHFSENGYGEYVFKFTLMGLHKCSPRVSIFTLGKKCW